MQRLPQFAVGWQPPDPRAVSLLAQPIPAHFRSVTASPNSDQATAQTIRIMCQHIEDGARDPLVCRAGDEALMRFRGGPPPAPTHPLVAAAYSDWWWAKHFLKFVHHEKLIEIWLGEIGQLQLLIPPEALVRMSRMVGDCAVYSMVLCSMLKYQGIRHELVTLATNTDEPAVFNHVYPRAVIDGVHLALDASHGDGPGWQVPSRDILRLQVWDEQGNPIADEGDRFAGLHGYRRGVSGIRGMGRARRRGGLGSIMRGLGTMVCCDYNGDYYDDGTTPAATTPTTPPVYGPSLTQLMTPTGSTVDNTGLTLPGASYPGGVLPSQTPAVPAAAASPWAALAANMGSAWTKIAGNVIAPQTTLVRGPNGQLYYSTPAGSTSATGSALLGTSLLGGASDFSGSTLLIVAAVVIGGIALMGKK